MIPRGIRNNNPGNIDRGTDIWQGEAPDQSSDARFIVFTDPKWGIRAIAKILLAYEDRHGRHTIRQYISAWAPPNENQTEAYITRVAKDMALSPDDPCDLHDQINMHLLVKEIIWHENGEQPYSDEVINAGVALAY